MLLKRIMPCLLFNGKGLIKTRKFRRPDYVGDPINAIKIYNEKEVDELIFLDITATADNRLPEFEKIADFASECFMPFTYGGGVATLDDFRRLFSIGVEKVAVNSLLFKNPAIVRDAVQIFGAQAIIGVIDVKPGGNGKYLPYNKSGLATDKNLREYCLYLQNEIGVGEILLQNVDREGTWSGYDHELIREIVEILRVPVIVLGGARDKEDIRKVLYDTGADAAAIGSMAVYQKKDMGVLIRFPKRESIIVE